MGDAMIAVEVSTEGQFKSGAVKRLFAAPGMMGNFPTRPPGWRSTMWRGWREIRICQARSPVSQHV